MLFIVLATILMCSGVQTGRFHFTKEPSQTVSRCYFDDADRVHEEAESRRLALDVVSQGLLVDASTELRCEYHQSACCAMARVRQGSARSEIDEEE